MVELLGVWPTFTKSIDRAGQLLTKIGSSWDLRTELTKSIQTSRMEEPEIAQPLSTAIQLALVDTLAELGVLPSLVAGHSSGEIAAAYCAKAISFEDAITVAYHRGRLASDLRKRVVDRPGSMLAVGAAPEVVDAKISELGDASKRLEIACYNSPSSVTVSGDDDAIVSLMEILNADEIFHRKLNTGGAAYHSHQMKMIEKEYFDSLEGIRAGVTDSSVIMVSSLTGNEIKETLIDRAYWVQNLVSPVQFAEATKKLCQTKSGYKRVNLILEVGPHSQMRAPIKQTLRTLRGDRDAHRSGYNLLATLFRRFSSFLAWLSMYSRFFWLVFFSVLHLTVQNVSSPFYYYFITQSNVIASIHERDSYTNYTLYIASEKPTTILKG
ncbi:uncharacterized protein TRUGW13939_06551 [Talaromyces rugulosus]|uniref:Malonyl-CoA:ACP transacylase (MAT) domain-containing protein n=1 Tax=Talaromyces rugulosus TaxID=121627 RepID=A0A7H8QZL3_TALRU|nr:uncharacterized protein TRUGW13939_06551 [Talaromyces rugulosus]QKX59417.1 hypothetical protein TRUGW13939_06551 [Talaromyces rugulosus]